MSMNWKAVVVPSELAAGLLAGGEVSKAMFSKGTRLRLPYSWHALQYLLAGHPWRPGEGAAALIRGGQPVGDELYGYGTASLLTPDEVARAAAELPDAVQAAKERYDPRELSMAELYPYYGAWPRRAREEVMADLDRLARFVNKAASQGAGILWVMS